MSKTKKRAKRKRKRKRKRRIDAQPPRLVPVKSVGKTAEATFRTSCQRCGQPIVVGVEKDEAAALKAGLLPRFWKSSQSIVFGGKRAGERRVTKLWPSYSDGEPLRCYGRGGSPEGGAWPEVLSNRFAGRARDALAATSK